MENLSRLASKPGVQSTLILSKFDGSIIHSTGLPAATSSSSPQDLSTANSTSRNGPAEPVGAIGSGTDYPSNTEDDKKGNSAEDIARMVFAFAAGAKAFIEGMDKSDEVNLLRLRTRKNEIVIVPGLSFTASRWAYAKTNRQIRNFYSWLYMTLSHLDCNTHVYGTPLWA